MHCPARKIKNHKETILMPIGKYRNYLLFVFFLLSINYTLNAQSLKADSLKAKLISANSLEAKANIMLQMSKELFYINAQEALEYASQAAHIFETENKTKKAGHCYSVMGAANFSLGKYKKAEKHFSTSLNYSIKTNDTLYIARALYNLANIKLQLGEINDAIKLFSKSAEHYQIINYTAGIIAIENNLSTIYMDLGKYKKALTHLNIALQKSKETENIHQVATILQNIGQTYLYSGEPHKALDKLRESYRLNADLGYTEGMVKNLMTFGEIYLDLNKNNDADTCLAQALQLARSSRLKEYEADILLFKGYLQLENDELSSSRKLFDQSLSIANEIGLTSTKEQAYEYLYYIDSTLGNFQLALESYIALQNLSDKKDNPEQTIEKLENIINSSKTEIIRQEATIRTNRTTISILAAGILGIFILSLFVIQQLKLKSQIKISELSQENLRSQMNPHFVFNILNSINYFILNNNKESSSEYLLKFARLLRLTLDNSKEKLVSISNELESLKLYLELESIRFNNQLEYEIILDEDIDPNMFKIPALLLQPYVENSIIHGFQEKNGKGKIEIKLNYTESNIHCTIADNGIGRKNAGKKQKSHKSHGTQITETRIKLLNSIYGKKMGVIYTDLTDESNMPKGTKVEFDLPILN